MSGEKQNGLYRAKFLSVLSDCSFDCSIHLADKGQLWPSHSSEKIIGMFECAFVPGSKQVLPRASIKVFVFNKRDQEWRTNSTSMHWLLNVT